MALTPDEAFERDVPEPQRDDIMTAMAEATQSGIGRHGPVYVHDHERIDAINARAAGIVTVGDTEFSFIMRDGNRDGTVLEGWENSGTQAFEQTPRTQWALVPRLELVGDAIREGKGPFLIAKWDAFIQRPEIARIPSNYAYDRMMQPGLKIEQHYKAEAAKHGFVLASQGEADSTRARLASATAAAQATPNGGAA